ncbi:hypothetical protein BSIN_4698 [Burkholderia singularis]|uniref:Uncharacterized protein n=1 Tax=Burkholderia singularis TaxID=1503053 RepID=A0A238H8Z7_9BURK|nr:hypothetical protein BSIN_4698 [Burkholderia singularis]
MAGLTYALRVAPFPFAPNSSKVAKPLPGAAADAAVTAGRGLLPADEQENSR